jgi:hypothetical protein
MDRVVAGGILVGDIIRGGSRAEFRGQPGNDSAASLAGWRGSPLD